jgi:hypothetical protein
LTRTQLLQETFLSTKHVIRTDFNRFHSDHNGWCLTSTSSLCNWTIHRCTQRSNKSKAPNALVITIALAILIVLSFKLRFYLFCLFLFARQELSNQVQTQARVCPPMSLNWTVLLVPERQCLL